jgi:hypothetical protein
LNGTAVEANRRVDWGLACHDPEGVEAQARPLPRPRWRQRSRASANGDAAIARRVEYLTVLPERRVGSYARWSIARAAEKRVAPGSSVLADAVARGYFPSCWRSSDEYEVARCTPTASSSGRSPPPSRATTGCAITSPRRCG